MPPCVKASEAALPEDGRLWSLKVCQRGVFRLGRDWRGNTRPVSDSLIRASGLNDGEPCQFHSGHMTVLDNGNTTMWYCGRPAIGGGSKTFVSTMKMARKTNGDTCGVGWHKSPLWTVLRYFSLDRFCGEAEW